MVSFAGALSSCVLIVALGYFAGRVKVIPHDGDGPAALGAFHSLEIATLFGTLSPELGGAYAGYAEAPADARAGELLRSVWGRFAHGAMPIAAGAHVDLDEEPVPWTADEPALLRCRALEGLR